MKRFTKLFQTKAQSIDEDAKTIRFKISDDQPDRMGEVVDQSTWNFKDYLKNPILLWGHNPDEPENVLGTTLSLDVEGDSTYATVQLDEDINPKAGLVWKQLLRGTLRTVSVGFINHTFNTDDDVPVLKDNELLEISIVPIPSNPRAIALAFKEGSLSRKDASWLLDSMQKEASLIEAQLKALPPTNERKKTMTEEQATAMLDSITKLTETVQGLKDDNATLHEELAALKPAEETPEEKAVREAAEKEAADKAAADEAARKAEEEAKTPPAKSGDDDQGGAGDGELDPEAEATPELQAQIDSALEEQELPAAA
jgi:HK97 family phage prohead protease